MKQWWEGLKPPERRWAVFIGGIVFLMLNYFFILPYVGELLAADGALRAGGLRAGEIPRPRLEAIGLGRQGADGTDLGDVAGEIVTVRPAGRGRDNVARPAILHHELPLVGDDVVEAHAALTDDASLFVEDDRRPEIHRFGL